MMVFSVEIWGRGIFVMILWVTFMLWVLFFFPLGQCNPISVQGHAEVLVYCVEVG